MGRQMHPTTGVVFLRASLSCTLMSPVMLCCAVLCCATQSPQLSHPQAAKMTRTTLLVSTVSAVASHGSTCSMLQLW
jgi:hypothetical protein